MADMNNTEPIDYAKLLEEEFPDCPHLHDYRGPHSRLEPTTTTSIVRSALHTILTYTIFFIIAAFVLVQVMETISFVLGLHTGIVWKGLWVAYLCATVFVAVMFVSIGHDILEEDGFGRFWPGRG
jgi:hypothetical protein